MSLPVMPSLSVEARKTARRAARSSGVPPLDLLLERTLVERVADALGAGLEHLVEEPRVERSRCDGVDVDPRAAQLLGKRLGEPDDRGLRRGVGAQARERRGGPAARELDDLAVPVVAEVGQHRARAQDRAEEIYPDGVLPLLPRDVLDRTLRPVDARVVHEHVDSREPLDGIADERSTASGSATSTVAVATEAGSDASDSSSARASVERRRVASADEHPRTRKRERTCDLEPETVAPSGDDRRSAGESGRHARRLPTLRTGSPATSPQRLEEEAVRVDDDRLPHRRHDRSGSTSRYAGQSVSTTSAEAPSTASSGVAQRVMTPERSSGTTARRDHEP